MRHLQRSLARAARTAVAPIAALALTAAGFARRHSAFAAAVGVILLAASGATWRMLRRADEIATARTVLPAESDRPLLARAAERPTTEIRIADGCVTPACHAAFTVAPRRHAAVEQAERK